MRAIMFLLVILLTCVGVLASAQKSGNPAAVFALADYQHVETTDFFMNPGRYIGKPVEFRRMLCTPNAGQGFSCATPDGRLTVLAADLAPDAEKKIIAERCLASDPLYRQRCKRTIRLVVGRVAGEKGADYSQQRLIVRAAMIEITPLDLDNSSE